jgi:ABC-type sugar transport system ATPase subunit
MPSSGTFFVDCWTPIPSVKTLSGGNHQKVVLAKWLLGRPSIFILDEPTRGIDIGVKQEVYRVINSLADQGTGILMISSEIEELLGICDRILVMAGGKIRDCIDRPQFDRERILRSALQGTRCSWIGCATSAIGATRPDMASGAVRPGAVDPPIRGS